MREVVQFDYYLHDELEHVERIAEIADSSGVDIDDELANKIGRPFYEVRLQCTLDPETGAVEILGAERVR